ncbi:MAG TPA: cytochrome c biogenesis protein CcsA [Candidatus Dormibacteraeota bacterium]|nr:cytochrome c biogenesis protein CcsA [Candidatus Dormibacteraeota bacterium]
MNLTDRLLPPAVIASMLAALYLVFVGVPTDSFQGPVQRIFYVHMAMWLATFTAFGLVGVASLLYLWKRTTGWDHLGRASAELGLVFCSLGLITGSIWAKPIWGTWWTWDPRLTLTLILWMIYAAYLLLRSLASEPRQGATLAAILGVSGVLDLYLINRAVYWWRGIHPAVIVNREGGSGLSDPLMRLTLVVCMLAFFLLFLWLLRLRIRTARLQDTVDDLRAQLAPAAP